MKDRSHQVNLKACTFLGKPCLKEVVDQGSEIVSHNQQNRQNHNAHQYDHQRKFDKTLSLPTGW